MSKLALKLQKIKYFEGCQYYQWNGLHKLKISLSSLASFESISSL